MNSDKPKRGRRPTARGAYNPNKVRQLGRVSDADWEVIKGAARRAGKSFTSWALESLKRAAESV